MPCSPLDVNITPPDSPSGSSISGFGVPFSIKAPNLSPDLGNFPEDLLGLLDKIKLLIPPGSLKPGLNPNFSKDVFDAIMSVLEKFTPFLMLYKFFLPILNLIICIIEVLCAIPNPFKLIRALKKLFTVCLPDFLNLFPIFAIIIMIISLLLLILAIIEYIISQILKLILALLRNIKALYKAFKEANASSILAIAKKLGALLCVFQNLFVVLAIFNIIIQVLKDILNMTFAIPPCSDGDSGNADSCCTPDVCPAIVKNQYTRTTGHLQYLNKVAQQTSVQIGDGYMAYDLRSESIQLYDNVQEQSQQFINIVNAYDVLITPKPIFFPTDAVYSSLTSVQQAPYTVDLNFLYEPSAWGRVGETRNVIFKDCIVINVPTTGLMKYDGSTANVSNGVIKLAGGLGYEADGYTLLKGYEADGYTQFNNQATLENFLHLNDTVEQYASLASVGSLGVVLLSNIEYTFKPNIPALAGKNLVTIGCDPSLHFSKVFINSTYAGDVVVKTAQLRNLINSTGISGSTGKPNVFPNPDAAQQCLMNALSALRSDLTENGVAQFQTTAMICLQKLKDDTNSALSSIIGIGFEPCKSSFILEPTLQFTSKTIEIKVDLNEKNGLPLTGGISTEIANDLAMRIKAYPTLGKVTNFIYDGYQSFIANVSSDEAGEGKMMVSFDNNIFCTNTIPANIDIPPTHDLQEISYQFIYTPASAISAIPPVSDVIRRDEGDIRRDIGE